MGGISGSRQCKPHRPSQVLSRDSTREGSNRPGAVASERFASVQTVSNMWPSKSNTKAAIDGVVHGVGGKLARPCGVPNPVIQCFRGDGEMGLTMGSKRAAAMLALSLCSHVSAQLLNEALQPAPSRSPELRSADNPFVPRFRSIAQFMAAAQQSPGWWQEWGADRYDGNSMTNDLVNRSATIKALLEEAGVAVPFDPGRMGLAKRSRVREGAVAGSPVEGRDWCAAITPMDLASAVAAVTALTAPEFAFPASSNPGSVRDNSKGYLQYVFRGLVTYCPADFVSKLQEFLKQYAASIEPRYQQELAAANAVRLAAQREQEEKEREAQERQEARKRLLAEKRAADDERRKQQQEQYAADRRAREQAFQERRMQQEAHVRDLKAGKAKPTTSEDVASLHDATPGDGIIARPPVNPDGMAYAMNGRLEKVDGDVLVFAVPTSNDIYYFSARRTPDTVMDQQFQLRYNGGAHVVGKFVGTRSYPTVSGGQRQMVVFEALAIGGVRY